MKRQEIDFYREFNQIFEHDDAPIDQLARGFHYILGRQMVDSEREMELLRALGDKEGLIREQIKHSTIEHVIARFGECYYRATGESWDSSGSNHA